MSENNADKRIVIESIYALSDRDKSGYLKKINPVQPVSAVTEPAVQTGQPEKRGGFGKVKNIAWIVSVAAALLIGVGITLAVTNNNSVKDIQPEEYSESPSVESAYENDTSNPLSSVQDDNNSNLVETINKGDMVYKIYDNGDMVVSGSTVVDSVDTEHDYTNVIIKDGPIKINEEAFIDRTNLKSIEIPATVRIIGYSAFKNCTGLTNVTISDNTDEIFSRAFEGCTNLSMINIPDKSIFIGEYAFDDTAWYNSQQDGDVYIGSIYYKYKGDMPADSVITIKDGTKSIATQAFKDRTELRTINIPDSVTEIGYQVFEGCSMLEDISIPDSVIKIGALAFGGTAWYNNQPSGDVYAGKVYYTFKGSMSPDTTVSIKEGTIGIASQAFIGFKELKNIVIPDSVKNIGFFAFSDCSGLESIVFPESIGSISYSVLDNCAGLNSITISDGIKCISERAFEGCSGITSITIPESVEEIIYPIFSNCENLKEIKVIGKSERPDSWCENWMGDCNAEIVWNA